ncbi:helix-turn-helix domain-containing protein [Leptolyngbya sp. NK1-12]|uniref:Helix-turn-helix domain-containing protein n=1 Tax=Leptolyngbya sp. NK1-12 TaxID=2547451 RepID=A0AA96WQM6_9CYAN|nr:helix-turn-helix domain-containing protein [Leptolyngbya sp. NK1-12]
MMNKQERNRNSIPASTDGLERIKAEMAKRGWRREDLVEQAQVSKATVDRFFAMKNVDASTVESIAEVLDLSMETIVDANVIAPPASYEFYIRRTEEEARCYAALQKPGAIVRVKGPQLMGKTLFLNEVLTKLSQRIDFRKVELDIDRQVLTNTEAFFKWLCVSVSIELDLPVKLDVYWLDELTPSQKITNYFQKYVLTEMANLNSSLLLVLDRVDHIFENLDIMDEFRALLRSWGDKVIKGSTASQKIWSHFRLVTVYSTDIYGLSSDIDYSPFTSIGTDVELSEFDNNQIEELARRYRLRWESNYTDELVKLVGGHPYLVDTAFLYIKHQKKETDKVLKRITETACTQIGIYTNHLLQITTALESCAELKSQFKEIVTVNEAMPIAAVDAFKLYSMGLIRLIDASENVAAPRCHLYQRYFYNYFKRQI